MKAVFTNTVVPVDAYRGAGRPEATYLLERLVEKAARETEDRPRRAPAEELHPEDAFPYQTPVALQYDSGDYFDHPRHRPEDGRLGRLRKPPGGSQESAASCAASASPPISRPAASRRRPWWAALGARAGLYECGSIRVHPTGSVTVFTGTHSHGQGHETTFAQLVSDTLGVPIESVEMSHGDTNKIPFGMGTYGSRSLAVGGSAIVKAMDKIIAKAKRIAAHLMEASVADIEFKNGDFTVTGTDKNVPFGTVALTAYVPHNLSDHELEPGLEETAFYDPLNFTYPGGSHICEVEIDPETGVTKVVELHRGR